MKALLGSLLVVLLCACSHPLEIVGEGDILSATGTRGCLLENSTAELANCTDNFVVGAYEETYFAVPRSGWVFNGWENYCTNTLSNECDFSASAGNVFQFWGETVPALRAIFTLDNDPDRIIVNGRTWLQPKLFTNLSWTQIETECPSGSCGAGSSLNGIDIAGYTWASTAQVQQLFNHYIGAPELNNTVHIFFATGLLQMLSEGWQLVGSTVSPVGIRGLTRDEHPILVNLGTGASVTDVGNSVLDLFATQQATQKNIPSDPLGAWLFKD